MKGKSRLKRLFAAVSAAVMMCGVLGLTPVRTMQLAEPITAEAYNWDLVDDYPSKYKAAALDALVDEWKYYNRECTSFVAWRLNSRNGVAFHNWYGGVNFGNATTWGSAARSIGITVDMNPAPGSVFWQTGEYGHVAWVNTVNSDGTVTIEEYNWNWDGAYHNRTVATSSASGYIHIADINPTPTGHAMSESDAAGQTIPDGDYIIFSEMNLQLNYDLNYILDITGTSHPADKGENVAIWGYEGLPASDCDLWTVKYQNNGFYTIYQKGTNMCLDVEGADLKRGANVQIWESNDSNAQQWSIRPTQHGYTLQAGCNAYFLDVSGGVAENGRNVQVWEGNDSKAQSWCFTPYNPDAIVEDGLYRIHSAVDEDFVLDVSGNVGEYKGGSNIQIWDSTGDDVFQITHDAYGYYYISEVSSGLVLDVTGTDTDYLTVSRNVVLYPKENLRNKKWAFFKNSDGTYCIISQLNGYALDLAIPSLDEGLENGKNVTQYTYHGRANQCWTLEPVELKSIKVDTSPDKTTYFIDEAFDPAGIVVNAVYSGDYSFKIAKGLTYEYDFSTAGKKTVTVKYECSGETLTATFDVTVNSLEFKGSGTKTDPYLIENKADLEKMRDLINSKDYSPAFRSCYYLQTADIALNDEKWIPIGKAWANNEQNTDLVFQGQYDGGQHWIHGLNVKEETKFAGLFGRINSAVIENLAVDGNVSGDNVSVGGIVGEIQNATVSDCCFIGDVSGKSTAAGGIVGYMWQSGNVLNCYHIGSVKTSDTHSAGGIVGRIQSNEAKNAVCTVENCYHVGKMESGQEYANTIVGAVDKADTDVGQKINLINCYGLSSDGTLYAGDKVDKDTAQAVKDSVLKLMAATLGDAYVKNPDSSYLDGYPIFQWQLSAPAFTYGDVNDDGSVDLKDVTLMRRALAGWDVTINEAAADVNKDGSFDLKDVVILRRYLAGGWDIEL